MVIMFSFGFYSDSNMYEDSYRTLDAHPREYTIILIFSFKFKLSEFELACSAL